MITRTPLLLLPLLLGACVASVGDHGPAGPPGPPGLPGPRYGQAVFATADLAVDPDSDIVIARAPLAVTLPAASMAGRGRTVTVRAAGGQVVIRASGGDIIEGKPGWTLKNGEAITLLSDGGTGWFAISASDL